MFRWILLLMVFLTACATPEDQSGTSQPLPGSVDSSQPPASTYPDLGAAPELFGDVWLNTDAPLRLGSLAGKVVLIDMWTFG